MVYYVSRTILPTTPFVVFARNATQSDERVMTLSQLRVVVRSLRARGYRRALSLPFHVK